MTIYACCNENRKAAILGNPRSTASTISKSSTTMPFRLPARASALYSSISSIQFRRISAQPTSLSPAEKASPTSQCNGSHPPPILPHRPWQTLRKQPSSPQCPTQPKSSSFASTKRATSPPYKLRLVNDAAQARERFLRTHRNPHRLRLRTIRSRVLLQGRVRSRLRLRPAASQLPARSSPPPINYLAKDYVSSQGLRLLPLHPP
jgi:hypothetical protein